jgi:hypothetical protein
MYLSKIERKRITSMSNIIMVIVMTFSREAIEQMSVWNVSEEEIKITIEQGQQFPSHTRKVRFRKDIVIATEENCEKSKEVHVTAMKQGSDWYVISVDSRYKWIYK